MTQAHAPAFRARMTPEQISSHDSLTRNEKLEELIHMKFDLERQSGLGTTDLDMVEQRMAALNLAVARVKRN